MTHSEIAGALVVTGGAQGIGATIVRHAVAAGLPVALLYRSSADAAERLVKEIDAAGGQGLAIAADVSVEDDVTGAFAKIDDSFGGVRGLVNNAVSTAGERKRLSELGLEQFESAFRTNLYGAFLCIREAVRRMSTRNGHSGGAVVSLSSTVAIKTGAPGSWVPFAASKAALETMSRGLATELAPEGVRVNVVRCGVVDTETRWSQGTEHVNRLIGQVPLNRIGTADEVANAVLWLLSDEASYVTGVALDVAGGL